MTTRHAIVLVFIAMASNILAGTPSSDVRHTRRLLCGGVFEIACRAVSNTVDSGKKQLTQVQSTLPTVAQKVITGDPGGAVATLTDAEITQTQDLLGNIASAVPGYNKLDPHCNGFTCNADSSPGTSGTCDSQFIAQSKTAYCGALPAAQCNVIKGSKIDYKKEIGFTADVVGASITGGPAGGLGEALILLQAELKTQYEAFISNAGPVGTEIINSALNNLGTIFDSVTQCGLKISLKADIQTSSGQQCALCLCSPTANAFTPYLAWKINGGCTSRPTTTGTALNTVPSLTPGTQLGPVGYGR